MSDSVKDSDLSRVLALFLETARSDLAAARTILARHPGIVHYVDDRGAPLFHATALDHNTAALRLLLESGVPADSPDCQGNTALQLLMHVHNSKNCYLAEAAVLLEAGANPNHSSPCMKSPRELAHAVPEDLRELIRSHSRYTGGPEW